MSLHKQLICFSLCLLLVGCQSHSSPNSLSASPENTSEISTVAPVMTQTPDLSKTLPESTQTPSANLESSDTPNETSQIIHTQLILSDPAILDAPLFEPGSPADLHGALHIDNTTLMDQNNEVFQLRGLSTHGIQWYSQYLNPVLFKSLRDDYHINTIRLALYADYNGAYPENQEAYTKILEEAIHAASTLGLYIIIDWHILEEGDPLIHEEDAQTFFNYVSKKYQNYDNVIFELCNEPNGNQVNWNDQIKPYAETLLQTIRGNGCKQLVIVGTPHWCQSPLSVVRTRLEDSNVLYAFHFYAGSHGTPLRDQLKTAVTVHNLPVIVSEFGTCEATGSGNINISQCDQWLDFLDEHHISWLNWSLCDKDETSAFLLPDTPSDRPIETNSLTESAKYITKRLLSYDH